MNEGAGQQSPGRDLSRGNGTDGNKAAWNVQETPQTAGARWEHGRI